MRHSVRPKRRNSRNFRRPRFQGGGRGRGPAKQTINYQRFINEATAPGDDVPYVSTHTFADFAFEPRLKQAIANKGYVTPTPIQDQAIGHILNGRDLVGLANTGTGKTAGFILPIINQLLADRDGMVLVVAPTRELAVQIDEEFRSFTKDLPLRSAICVGGIHERKQLPALRQRPQMVIGTPGRLKDFINKRHLRLDNCRTFVLDEADRMLDMGFLPDMKFMIQRLPQKRQSLCFSATMTAQVKAIIGELLRDPVAVSVKTSENSDHITQNIIRADSPNEKIAELKQLLAKSESEKVLIFGETKHGVQRLANKLDQAGTKVAAIHGNKSQSQRQRALNAFKNDHIQVLVATDVAARGLDVPSVTHVVNYDVPKTYDDYIHRIGRTGRIGNRGTALTFIPSAS